jgi:transposase-like protein
MKLHITENYVTAQFDSAHEETFKSEEKLESNFVFHYHNLECDNIQSSEILLMIQKNVVPPSSWYRVKMEAAHSSETLMNFYQA